MPRTLPGVPRANFSYLTVAFYLGIWTNGFSLVTDCFLGLSWSGMMQSSRLSIIISWSCSASWVFTFFSSYSVKSSFLRLLSISSFVIGSSSFFCARSFSSFFSDVFCAVPVGVMNPKFYRLISVSSILMLFSRCTGWLMLICAALLGSSRSWRMDLVGLCLRDGT